MVASLSPDHERMNTAFVSSIYGVILRHTDITKSVFFVHSSYSLVSANQKIKIIKQHMNQQ